jgi:hypothetical protein
MKYLLQSKILICNQLTTPHFGTCITTNLPQGSYVNTNLTQGSYVNVSCYSKFLFIARMHSINTFNLVAQTILEEVQNE